MPGNAHTSPLSTNLAGVRLSNPVLLAAGTAGTLDELADVLDLRRVGGVVTKSITAEAREGNATWRIIPTDHGMLNAIGLANIGIDAFMRDYAHKARSAPTTIIGSISEFSIDGFVRVAAAFASVPGMPAVELNVSCPNVNHGCEFGADETLLADLVSNVRRVLPNTRLFVKLSPIAMGRPGIVAIAKAAIEPPGAQPMGPNQRPGADALCIANTVPAMAIDVETRRPRLSRGGGGLSGPGIHPIAVRLVHDAFHGICKSTATPIVGIGGVLHWQDAAEFVLAGATAVEIGTGLFADPRCPLKVAEGLERWVRRLGVTNISELVGQILPPDDPTATP
ncbi:MAG: dihydroorotate dehydrogenase [Planctomycetes bacterium]|nr:dihydroorotate dehydrogenase [Planctomycetota bacterium]